MHWRINVWRVKMIPQSSLCACPRVRWKNILLVAASRDVHDAKYTRVPKLWQSSRRQIKKEGEKETGRAGQRFDIHYRWQVVSERNIITSAVDPRVCPPLWRLAPRVFYPTGISLSLPANYIHIWGITSTIPLDQENLKGPTLAVLIICR